MTTNSPSEPQDLEKRFFHVEIYCDGSQVAAVPVAAYTEDMAIVRALVPELLYRLGLMEWPGSPGPPGHPEEPVYDYNSILDAEDDKSVAEL